MTDKTQEASHTSAPVDYTRDAEPPWSPTVREADDPCGCQDSVELRAEVKRLRQTRSTGEAFAALEIERNQLRADVQRLRRERDEAVHLLRLISDVDGEEDDLVKLARMADLECNCENDRAKEAEAKVDQWRPVIEAAKAWRKSDAAEPIGSMKPGALLKALAFEVDALLDGTSDKGSDGTSDKGSDGGEAVQCAECGPPGATYDAPQYPPLSGTGHAPEPERLRGTVPVRHDRPVIAECRMPLVAPERVKCEGQDVNGTPHQDPRLERFARLLCDYLSVWHSDVQRPPWVDSSNMHRDVLRLDAESLLNDLDGTGRTPEPAGLREAVEQVHKQACILEAANANKAVRGLRTLMRAVAELRTEFEARAAVEQALAADREGGAE